jgi:hypothetical protein
MSGNSNQETFKLLNIGGRLLFDVLRQVSGELLQVSVHVKRLMLAGDPCYLHCCVSSL